MGVLKKNVRFHTENESDMQLYEAVCHFRSYGYRSESHMIIEGLKKLLEDEPFGCSPDELADLIADRLAPILKQHPIDADPNITGEGKTKGKLEDKDYEKIFGFLDSL